jgi:hypothetical protein
MKPYAESTSLRMRQMVGDISLLVWVAAWAFAGVQIHDLVEQLAGPGRSVEQAGGSFVRALESAGDDIGSVPVVGDALERTLETVAGGGRALQSAGVAQQEAVQDLAFWLGILLAVIPIAYGLARYVPPRVRWMREAGAATRLRLDGDDLHLFALRAVANRPLDELRRASEDPGGDLAAGRYEALAELELRALGLDGRGGRRSR